MGPTRGPIRKSSMGPTGGPTIGGFMNIEYKLWKTKTQYEIEHPLYDSLHNQLDDTIHESLYESFFEILEFSLIDQLYNHIIWQISESLELL
jgi:hypothetical protein